MKETAELRLRAPDLSCSACAGDIESLLREKHGVVDAWVDFAGREIRVLYDPALVDAKKVFMEARKLGFELTVIKD